MAGVSRVSHRSRSLRSHCLADRSDERRRALWGQMDTIYE